MVQPTASRSLAKPSIAVVVPARNAAAFLARALETVWTQTRPPDEVIVVDDGSTDATTASIESRRSRLRVIQTPPRGVAAARNEGVSAATATFVAFLDADDYWDRDHLQRMEDAIVATNGGAGLYFSDIRIAPERGGRTLWAHCNFAVRGTHELREHDKTWLFLSRQPILLQASVVSRDAYLAVGGSDTKLARRSDTHVIFKLGLARPICAVAGTAGELTASNDASLTRVYAAGSRLYELCTLAMYRDLLATETLDRDERGIVRGRAAAAARWLARDVGPRRRPVKAMRYFVVALSNSPRATVAALFRATRSRPSDD